MRNLVLIAAILFTFSGWATAQTVGIHAEADEVSATKATTASLFDEPADRYLDVFGFTQMKDPVFFFQFAPTSIGSGANVTTDPMQLGLGARWFDFLYTGVHAGFKQGTQGLLTSNKSTEQSQAPTVVVDPATGAQIGQTLTSSTEVWYQVVQYQALTLLGGLNMGSLSLGVKNVFQINNSDRWGTYDAIGSTAASTSTVTTVNGKVRAGSYNSVPDDGYQKNQSFSNALSGGARLPLGLFDLVGSVGLTTSTSDTGEKGGLTIATTQAEGGYGSFEGFANVVDLNRVDELVTQTSLTTEIPIYAGVELPLPFFQNPSLLKVGANYTLSATVNNTGEIYRQSTVNRSTTIPATGIVQTTDTRSEVVQTRPKDSYGYQQFEIPFQFTVTPSPDVRFAVAYKPSIYASGSSSTVSYSDTSKVVVDDHDGVAADQDADDKTTVTVIKDQDVTTATDYLALRHELASAVQIVLFKDLLRLNLGTRAYAIPVSRSTTSIKYSGVKSTSVSETVLGATSTTTSTPELPSANQDTKTTYDSTSASVNVATELGLTLWINPNVSFDLKANNVRVLNLAATTDDGGLLNLNNFTILMTISLPPPAAVAK